MVSAIARARGTSVATSRYSSGRSMSRMVSRRMSGKTGVTLDALALVLLPGADEPDGACTGLGAEVLETVGNVHKKAGALNQDIDLLLPSLDNPEGHRFRWIAVGITAAHVLATAWALTA